MKVGTVIISGVRYDVVVRKFSIKEDPKRELKPWGICDYEMTKIALAVHQGHERRYVNFIHECVHALLHESVSEQYLRNGKLEDFIQNMEAPLAAFIRDNIKLIRKIGRF